MKPELLRHIEILKTVPEIKKDIEELKFWCILEKFDNLWNKRILWRWYETWTFELQYHFNDWVWHNSYQISKNLINKIIWQVEERHLRMFLKDKSEVRVDINIWWLIFKHWYMSNWWIYLDNSKPYMEQSSEFFKKLNDWIVKEFNIKL